MDKLNKCYVWHQIMLAKLKLKKKECEIKCFLKKQKNYKA